MGSPLWPFTHRKVTSPRLAHVGSMNGSHRSRLATGLRWLFFQPRVSQFSHQPFAEAVDDVGRVAHDLERAVRGGDAPPRGGLISMRWLVVCASAPAGPRRRRPPPTPSRPGRGSRRQAPSVYTSVSSPCHVDLARGRVGPGTPARARDVRPARPYGEALSTHGDRRHRMQGPASTIVDGFAPASSPTSTRPRPREWLDSLDAVVDARGRTRARFLIAELIERAARARRRLPATVTHAVHQHHPARRRSRGSRATSTSSGGIRAYIRWNAAVMVVKANKHAEGIGGHLATFASLGRAVRRRLQPLLPGQGRRSRRATTSTSRATPPPASTPGPTSRVASPRSSSTGSAARSAATACRATPTPGSCPTSGSTRRCRWGSARINVDLPGPLQPLPANQRQIDDTSELEGVVLHRRRRVRRARDARLASRWPPASASTTSSWSSTATSSGSTGRCGATARSSRSSRRSSGARAGTSSRSSGARSGTSCWPATSTACSLNRMNPPSTASSSATRSSRAPTSVSTSSAPTRGCAAWSSTSPTRSLRNLPRGGHDYRKLYAAYKAATEHEAARPTVILAKTIKGWTLGPDVEARNATHQIKKMTPRAAPGAAGTASTSHDEIPDEVFDRRRRRRTTGRRRARPSTSTSWIAGAALDGSLPEPGRAHPAPARACPTPTVFEELDAGSGKQAVSTTMAFTRLLRNLCATTRFGPARRADHPRRGPHLRHGLAVQGVRHLRRAGPAVRAGRRRAAALLHARPGRADPRGGHHRGRARWPASPPPAPPTPPAACRWCRSSSSTRCSASSGSATSSGRRPTPAAGASCSAPPPVAPRSLGEGLQHQDGHSLVLASTVPPSARRTTRRSPTRWRRSSRTV